MSLRSPITGYTAKLRLNLVNYLADIGLVQKYEQQNWTTVDTLLYSLANLVAPIWALATSYQAGNRVVDTTTGKLYICNVPHRSGVASFANDRLYNPSYWTEVTGPTGPAGRDGNSVRILGHVSTVANLPTTGNTLGDGYIVDATGHLYSFGANGFVDVGQFKGDKGDQGPIGIPGIQGVQGIQGIQGIQGVAGSKGDQGSQGIQGPGPTNDQLQSVLTNLLLSLPTSLPSSSNVLWNNGGVISVS